MGSRPRWSRGKVEIGSWGVGSRRLRGRLKSRDRRLRTPASSVLAPQCLQYPRKTSFWQISRHRSSQESNNSRRDSSRCNLNPRRKARSHQGPKSRLNRRSSRKKIFCGSKKSTTPTTRTSRKNSPICGKRYLSLKRTWNRSRPWNSRRCIYVFVRCAISSRRRYPALRIKSKTLWPTTSWH